MSKPYIPKKGESHILDSTPRELNVREDPEDIFHSELVRTLLAWINDCIAHVNSPRIQPDAFDLRVFAAEAGLTDAQHEALAMTAEGWSTREVATFLEISQTAVQRRLVRLRDRLQRHMDLLAARQVAVGGTQNLPTTNEGGLSR